MEKRKKEHKQACGYSQEPQANDLSNKDDKNEQHVALTGKNKKTSSPSNDNTASENKQPPLIVQWPYAAQNASDQTPLTSKPPLQTQTLSPLPTVISQWHFPNQHQPLNNPVQQGHIPFNYAQPIPPPFWLPQRPSHPLPGMNAPATFPPLIPLGTTEVNWQAPAVGGGAALTSQPQVPNFCYPVGCSYPGLQGPCDPLAWWDQTQQSQPLCTYSFPGASSYFSSTPSSIPSCSTSPVQAFQRGVIRPSAKVSQKHRQLWESQSAENVQLWNVINHLQSELADYKNRLSKLEVEISSLKQKVEGATAQVTANTIAVQPPKRGRPKRPVDAIGSPDASHPRARGGKPATSKVQSETKPHLFGKVVLNKAVDKDKTCHSAATMEQGNRENVSSNDALASNNAEMNGSNLIMPTFHSQAHLQMCGLGFTPSLEMKSDEDKATNSKTASSILSQHATEMNIKSSSAFYIGGRGNGTLGWPANIASEESRRNIGSQGYYNNGSVIREGGKLIPGWSFISEEHASQELEDAALGSAKDEEDEEMGEDASSGAEDIARAKDDGIYNIDGTVGTNPKGLPPLSNW